MTIPDDVAEALISVHESFAAVHKRIDRVESDRASRMAELERTVNERLSQDAKAAVKRIETLERGEKELYARCQEVAGAALDALRDRDRQDRWHATYDAVLPVVLQMCVQGCSDGTDEDEDPGETAHRDACASADRAHRPLEVSGEQPQDGEQLPFDPSAENAAGYKARTGKDAPTDVDRREDGRRKAVASMADRAHGPLEAIPEGQRVLREVNAELQVNALVKAARRQLCGHTRADHDGGCGCPACELAGAAEPFETERSE